MSRNRFQSLLYSIHFVDNFSITEDMKVADKLWKVRPFLNELQMNCLAVTPGEHCSVDDGAIQWQA